MRTGWGVGAWSLVGLVTLGLLPLLVLGWAIPNVATSDAAARSEMPWNWLLVGLLLVSCLGILVARPILIPWTVVNARRMMRRLLPRTTRFEPPFAPGPWQVSRVRTIQFSDRHRTGNQHRSSDAHVFFDASRVHEAEGHAASEAGVRT